MSEQARSRAANGSREPRAGRDAQHANEDKQTQAQPQGAGDATTAYDVSRLPVILVVEDDEPIAEVVALVLEDAGYQPTVAANGQEALEIARRQWPALVITDLMMPHMNGLELVVELRAISSMNGHRMPPVVLMTAASVVARHPEVLGVDAVVPKPFEIATLEATIRRLLGPSSSE